ncbi:HalD/BesD family halogenase [Ruegeria arenilitoris]|uniref:HalD/BesD family halogenase n=1 Tax=Ruegeria arenilitoris TaxID=1173585 RepID=UPI00147F5E87|nr:2OG-Fe(II) oxygenase [Ruegeria arenilitoris]
MRDILDLERFPLDQPGSEAWKDLVKSCRRDLAQEGMFNLEGLLHRDVARRAVADMRPRFDTEAFLHQRRHNIYFKKIADLPDDHPALQEFDTSNRTLCADQIAGSALLRLYEWPEFAQFLAATMDKPALHVMDDPMASVNVMSYQEGQALNWHFDRSEFTTTLLLQAPAQGGQFEYRTNLRSDTDPNYEGVARLLNSEDDQSKTITLSPGTLNVFKGKNTAHRVTPVVGDEARVIAVFSYYEQPGVSFTSEERMGFYGRA